MIIVLRPQRQRRRFARPTRAELAAMFETFEGVINLRRDEATLRAAGKTAEADERARWIELARDEFMSGNKF